MTRRFVVPEAVVAALECFKALLKVLRRHRQRQHESCAQRLLYLNYKYGCQIDVTSKGNGHGSLARGCDCPSYLRFPNGRRLNLDSDKALRR